MDLDKLCAALYEALDGRVVEVYLDEPDPYSESYAVRVAFECDPFDGTDSPGRLRFEIACHGVREMTLTRRAVEELAFLGEHPLLLEYGSPHEYLHFSSAPDSPEEVIGRLYLAHRQVVGDWRPLSRVLNPCVESMGFTLPALLRSGRGMLARGPAPVIAALEEAVAPLMRVYRNPSHPPGGGYRVLLFDDAYVVCLAAEVVSIRSAT